MESDHSSQPATTKTSSDDRTLNPTTMEEDGSHNKLQQQLPAPADVDAAGGLEVLRADGTAIPFRKIFSGDSGDDTDATDASHDDKTKTKKRVLVIFVRHFFCGNCQGYIQNLTRLITPESLRSLSSSSSSSSTSIAIIGCGSHELIPMYMETTGCQFPIYADPSKKLYEKLGMTRSLSLGSKKPDYQQRSMLLMSLMGVFQALSTGTRAVKGGDMKQNGGEFLFDDGTLVWAHRMQNTRDHAELPELKRLLGFVENL